MVNRKSFGRRPNFRRKTQLSGIARKVRSYPVTGHAVLLTVQAFSSAPVSGELIQHRPAGDPSFFGAALPHQHQVPQGDLLPVRRARPATTP